MLVVPYKQLCYIYRNKIYRLNDVLDCLRRHFFSARPMDGEEFVTILKGSQLLFCITLEPRNNQDNEHRT